MKHTFGCQPESKTNDHRGAIAAQLAVRSQQQHRLHPALAHQQAIKGIPVDAIGFQFPHGQQVGVADRQPTEALLRHLALQFRQIHLQPADRHLDRYLPQRCLAHEHLRLRRLHPLHHGLRQPSPGPAPLPAAAGRDGFWPGGCSPELDGPVPFCQGLLHDGHGIEH